MKISSSYNNSNYKACKYFLLLQQTIWQRTEYIDQSHHTFQSALQAVLEVWINISNGQPCGPHNKHGTW